MSTHNECFHAVIRKLSILFCWKKKAPLFGAMHDSEMIHDSEIHNSEMIHNSEKVRDSEMIHDSERISDSEMIRYSEMSASVAQWDASPTGDQEVAGSTPPPPPTPRGHDPFRLNGLL